MDTTQWLRQKGEQQKETLAVIANNEMYVFEHHHRKQKKIDLSRCIARSPLHHRDIEHAALQCRPHQHTISQTQLCNRDHKGIWSQNWLVHSREIDL